MDTRTSLIIDKGRGASKGHGGGSVEKKTAAQLLQLQKLVESLVVRELNGEAGSAQPSDDAASHRSLQQAHSHSSKDAAGAPRHAVSKKGSRGSSADHSHSDLGARNHGSSGQGRDRPSGTGAPDVPAGQRAPVAASTGPRDRTSFAAGGSAAENGVPVQVATLQGQLALIGEQLSAAYRAAEGMASPRAGAAMEPTLRAQGLLGSNGVAGRPAGLGTAGYVITQAPFLDAPVQPISPVVAAAAHKPQYLTSAMTAGPVASMSEYFSEGGGGVSGGGGAGDASGGAGSSGRMRQVAEERASREASAREDERLRSWIQDLRAERRRLEDRLLASDSMGSAGEAQQLRDDLEKQVLSLSRQRDQLAAELRELGITKAANAQLAGQVEALGQALAAEGERVARYKEIRPALEARLSEMSASLEALRRQHDTGQEALARDRDAALLKARRAAKRASELEAALAAANGEVRRLHDEARNHDVLMAEARASGEVLQATSQQLQASMETQAREAATRLATVQAQLESSQSDCLILRRQLDTTRQEAAGLRSQLQDVHVQLEAAIAERERLNVGLTDEQRTAASSRQELEALQLQLKSSEEARAEAARLAFAQQEGARRQHAAELAAMQKQYESQLAAAEKQYLMLQRQYDAGLASSDLAAEAAAGLRRERDALWAEAQNLKAELEEARKEKADVSSKLSVLRSEVRSTVDEVAKDRDARLAAAASQNDAMIREVRAEADRRVASIKQEYETRIKGLNDSMERLRAETSDSQRQVGKYRTTVSHLKDQVRELLLRRDAVERELASERSFNEELNRILAAMRAEQQGGA